MAKRGRQSVTTRRGDVLVIERPAAVIPKFNLTSSEAAEAFGSPRLFKRLRYHKWVYPLREGSSDALYSLGVLQAAQARLEAGECLPLLPSEVRELAARAALRKEESSDAN